MTLTGRFMILVFDVRCFMALWRLLVTGVGQLFFRGVDFSVVGFGMVSFTYLRSGFHFVQPS
ncbi:hypothetical protein HanPSC8_Chr13g0586371 [Helianthus annuus]|nr:hypothetical protein HanPSC8_Chr13g0586371 [Helianthus annuus]